MVVYKYDCVFTHDIMQTCLQVSCTHFGETIHRARSDFYVTLMDDGIKLDLSHFAPSKAWRCNLTAELRVKITDCSCSFV